MAMFVLHLYFVSTMNQFGRVLIICTAIAAATGAAVTNSKTITEKSSSKSVVPQKTPESSTPPYDSVNGVISIAGVASRNGRLSSMNGFKFYPPIDSSMINTDDKGNFILKDTDGKMPLPLTITKEGDGVSGTIQILPGSVSVMSSAKSGSTPNFNPWPAPLTMNDIFFPPFPVFHSRIPEPYFPKEMFKQSLPRQDMLRPWLIPPFSPFFNFW